MGIRIKKGMAIILVMLMVMGGMSGIIVPGGGTAYAAAVAEFAGGDGITEATAFEIKTADQLNAVRNHLGTVNAVTYFKLVDDVDLSAYSTTDAGKGWEPIGTNLSPFYGIIDGNDHTITGLTINRSTHSVGLFGKTGAGSSIKNIKLKDVIIKGHSFLGGLVGNNDGGDISNSYVTGSVTGSEYVGGLVGNNMRGHISDSYVTGSVVGGNYYAGGLVGFNYEGDISNSYFTGDVSGGNSVGGLAGNNNGGDISNSYTTGSVSVRYNFVGGMVGYNLKGDISNSYATGSVSGSSDYVGGMVGYNYEGDISNSYATGSVIGNNNYVGGLVGLNSKGIISSNFYDLTTTGQQDTGKGKGLITDDMKLQSTYVNWSFSDIWAIDSLHNNGYPYLQVFQVNLNYDGNGNTGGDAPIDSHVYSSGVTASVYSGTVNLVKTNYAFDGWNTLANGMGKSYEAADTFTLTTNKTLYAKWKSTIATLTSTIGTVSAGGTANETITNIPSTTTLAELKAAITTATNATYEIYEADGTTVATELATGNKIIVTAQDGLTKVTYTVMVSAALSADATLTSTIGTVSTGGTANETITNIPSETTLAELKAAITTATNATYEIYEVGGITVAKELVSGNKIIVTAQDGLTKVTYTVTIKAVVTPPSSGGSGGSGVDSTPPTSPNDNKVIGADGKLTIPVGRTGEVSLGNAVTISVPAGVTSKELKLTIEKVLDTQKLLTNREVLASPVFEILKNFPENFSKPVTLTFTFDKGSLKSNQTVSVFYYDEVKKAWVKVEGGNINGNRITVEVNHFTKYVVLVVDKTTGMPVIEKPTDIVIEINFSDIAGHWAEANIKQAVSSGIATGYQEGTFKPEASVSRGEFTVMLMNTLKLQGEGVVLTFTDTAEIGAWAQQAVARAVQAGIIKGNKDGTFSPNAEITRAEMAVMLAKALGQANDANAETGFADDEEIPAWAKGSVAVVKQVGIVQGKGFNEFGPQEHATRAEAVTVLLKLWVQKSN